MTLLSTFCEMGAHTSCTKGRHTDCDSPQLHWCECNCHPYSWTIGPIDTFKMRWHEFTEWLRS